MLMRVFEQPDGKLRITKPGSSMKKLPNESDAAFMDRVAKEAIKNDPSLAGLSYADLDQSALPPTREQRSNWRLKDGQIVVLAKE